MYHIKNLKAKEPKFLPHYYFGSEKLRGTPKKVQLVEAVTEFFRNDWGGFVQMKVGVMTGVTNYASHEAGEDMEERYKIWPSL